MTVTGFLKLIYFSQSCVKAGNINKIVLLFLYFFRFRKAEIKLKYISCSPILFTVQVTARLSGCQCRCVQSVEKPFTVLCIMKQALFYWLHLTRVINEICLWVDGCLATRELMQEFFETIYRKTKKAIIFFQMYCNCNIMQNKCVVLN